MRFSRFERKILLAIAAMAIVPLLGALLLGQRVLSEAYDVGVNARVRKELEQGLSLYREHFAALRRSADQVANAVAADHTLVMALQAGDRGRARARLGELLAAYDGIARVRVLGAGGEELVAAERPERLAKTMRLLDLRRALAADAVNAATPAQLAITVATPAAPFRDYQRAGELVEVYARLQSESALLSTFFLVVYIGFLLSVIVAALAVSVAISRRVTRRVSDLAEATERVGAGDLTVQVATRVDDEIGDLTKAFNEMVRDLRDSRGRIDYLQRISAWQDFARRLAHEIKNPLTPIQLAVQEVHRRYRGDDAGYKQRLDESVAIVGEEIATLRRLVSEFSAFAKLPQAQLEPADLNEFLRETTRALQSVPEELNCEATISVHCHTAPSPLPVRIDAMMLKRAVDNLVRNAAQALMADPKRPHGLVRVSVGEREGFASIQVEDDGPGVPVDSRSRVFDPYYTTKVEGTGLGLAIVKKVVLEHGGEIDCAASSLGGAQFSIRLPLRSTRR